MKNIDDYIKEITNHNEPEYDLIDECILSQLNIYYNFNLLTITESMIIESKGSFPNQSDIVNQILKNIDTSKSTNIINIDNEIIDRIYLHFKYNSNNKFNCEYIVDNVKYDDYNIVRWDNDKERYRFAEFNVINYISNDDLEELLYHETQHLWDDYQLMKHKNISLSAKIRKLLDNKFADSNINDTLKEILYYTNDYEISSYISQMNGMFHNKKFSDIKDAFNSIIYPSNVYQNYKWIYYALYTNKYVNDLINIGVKKSELTNMKIRIKKKFHKIINHAYHICGEHTVKHLNYGSIQDKYHKKLEI